MRLCLVGTGRCGLTLLQRMLDSHPDLFVFPETHWLPILHEKFGDRAVSSERLGELVMRTHHVTGLPTTRFDRARLLTAAGPTVTVREFADALGGLCAAQAGKAIWADKTPDYGYFIGTLQELWPDCKIVHLIRDGVAVARSMSYHPGFQVMARSHEDFWCPLALDFEPGAKPAEPPDPQLYPELWRNRLLRTRAEYHRLAPGSFREYRYEAMTQDPVSMLSDLCDFTGLDPVRDWIAGAAAMVDADRANRPRPDEWLAHFDRKSLQLLAELGYADAPA